MKNKIISGQVNSTNSGYLKTIYLSFALIGLAACSIHKSSFDCTGGKGMGCGSMIEVHKAIKNNSFDSKVESLNKSKSQAACISCKKNNLDNKEVVPDNLPVILSASLIDTGTSYKANSVDRSIVSRSKDKIMQIWFNSYFDQQNNFHDSQYIYTIIAPAQWLVNKNGLSS